ncbi:MAG TPA: hypothetical protein H9708_01610 [Candidatus Borkfalkia stercoripullorum]|nr:hypothetical protein [Candidatus Borkfalkia stercoripullorum]
MSIIELLQKIEPYRSGSTSRLWTKNPICFNNEYIEVKRLDSSNKWLGLPRVSEMGKMWSIIVDLKKDFCELTNYCELSKKLDIKLTRVTKGELKGCWGIRIYKMKQNPTNDIIYDILNFIFQQ